MPIEEKKGYKTTKDGEQLLAVADGFYEGRRVRAGTKFHATNKGERFGWAEPADAPAKRRTGKPDPDDKDDPLNRPLRDLLPALKTSSDADLRALRDGEARGQNRVTLLTAIDDEIATRLQSGGASLGGDPFN